MGVTNDIHPQPTYCNTLADPPPPHTSNNFKQITHHAYKTVETLLGLNVSNKAYETLMHYSTELAQPKSKHINHSSEINSKSSDKIL